MARKPNGRWDLHWESTSTYLSDAFEYETEAKAYAATFTDNPRILNVVLFDRDVHGTFEVLKGRMFDRVARAIPTRKDVTLTRAEMLLLERILPKVIAGDLQDPADQEAVVLLAKVQSVRAQLEDEQAAQRAMTAAAKDGRIIKSGPIYSPEMALLRGK